MPYLYHYLQKYFKPCQSKSVFYGHSVISQPKKSQQGTCQQERLKNMFVGKVMQAKKAINVFVMAAGLALGVLPSLSSAAVSSEISMSASQNWTLDSKSLPREYRMLNKFDQASFVLLDPTKRAIYAKNPEKPLIPASTLKVVTALLALEHWGRDHHFYTDIYTHISKTEKGPYVNLIFKGYGDPFLISEELKLMAKKIAKELKSKNITRVNKITLDGSFYDENLKIPGLSKSENPFDAMPTALAANFNTAMLYYNGKSWFSAEKQTPLTYAAVRRGKNLLAISASKSRFRERVNLGQDPKLNEQNFAEIIRFFLRREGIKVGKKIRWNMVDEIKQSMAAMQADSGGTVQVSQKLSKPLRYYNSKSLEEVVAAMLEHSTNLVANQLALNLAADLKGAPATQAKLQQTYNKLLRQWIQPVSFVEGSGLSRDNKLTATQMLTLLNAFEPYQDLMPKIKPGIHAKTGTLHGVSALAGYIEKSQQQFLFALLINGDVPYKFRDRLLQKIRVALEPK